MRSRVGFSLVSLGAITGAFARWYLIWLFARTAYGLEAVGTYSLLLAVGTPVFVAAQMGLRTVFVSSTEQWPWKAFLKLRAVGIILGSIVLLAFVLLSPQVPTALGFAVLAMKVFDSLTDLFLARVQFAGRLITLGLLTTGPALATVLLATGTVWIYESATGAVAVAALVSALAAGAAGLVCIRVEYVADRRGSSSRSILRASLLVTASQFLATSLFHIPILLVASSGDVGQTGVFAAVAYVLVVFNLAGSTLQTVLVTPFRITLRTQGSDALKARMQRTLKATIVVGFIACLTLVVGGPSFIEIVYGAEFVVGTVVVLLLAGAAFVTMISYILSVSLNVMNRYGKVTLSMGIGCLASLAVGALGLLLDMQPVLAGAICVAAGAIARATALFFQVRRGE